MNKNPLNDLEKYRNFLETIPLVKYREELKDIKGIGDYRYEKLKDLFFIE
jgi:hypothetical protein